MTLGILVACAAGASSAGLLMGGRARLRAHLPGAPSRPGVLAGLGLAGAATIAIVLDGRRLVLAVVGVLVVAAVVRQAHRRRRLAVAERRADRVLHLCEGLAADLRAGQPPATALGEAVADWPELAPVAAAARLGADVPQALRALAATPGAAELRLVAAAWQVAHRSGAGLATSLGLAAGHLRAVRATARVVTTEMAAAQATAKLLAALPVAVLLLGSGLGGDPVSFLLGTPPGLVCLCAGLCLQYAGLTWLGAIGDRVTGRRER